MTCARAPRPASCDPSPDPEHHMRSKKLQAAVIIVMALLLVLPMVAGALT